MNCDELDKIIYGRIKPHIYAFNTNKIPNYLKVGDTYRPVEVRLNEWRQVFPDLEEQFQCSASISDDIYFRDYSVHQFLEREKMKHRLIPEDLAGINLTCNYFSNEFFEDINNSDIEEAVSDIKSDYTEKSGKYAYWSISSTS